MPANPQRFLETASIAIGEKTQPSGASGSVHFAVAWTRGIARTSERCKKRPRFRRMMRRLGNTEAVYSRYYNRVSRGRSDSTAPHFQATLSPESGGFSRRVGNDFARLRPLNRHYISGHNGQPPTRACARVRAGRAQLAEYLANKLAIRAFWCGSLRIDELPIFIGKSPF